MSLLFLPLVWCVTAAGRTLTSWLRLPDTATRLERGLIAFGLGLGLLAYGVLLLGLFHLLYPVAGLLWVCLLAMLGGNQHILMVRTLRAWRPMRLPWWGWGLTALFAVFGIIALIGVYAPPVMFLPGVNATEWDSLSYHLADPELFLRLHRVVSLPWQPHSNFAFTSEMWFTLALMAHGSVPLAKWFSWACAVGTALGVYAIGGRHLTPRVGLWAALLFVSTPLAFWEAGTAYIDGATAFFATVALLCVMAGLRTRQRAWLWVGAVQAGFALSTKATALAPLVVLAAGLLVWEWQQRSPFGATRLTLGWSLLALLVGSPWYLKSWVCTGNPIYPYFYSLFGGRWWGPHWAASYAAANNPGLGHSLSAALLLPWNVTMALLPGHVVGGPHTQPFNEFPSPLLALSPVLLAALFFPVFGLGNVPKVVKALAVYALLTTLLWFTQTQFVRFLLPLLPVYCLLAAWTLCCAIAARTFSGYALASLVAASVFWSLSVGGGWASLQWPVVSGEQTRSAYLTRYNATFPAMQFVNHSLPPQAKIALFGDPLGFGCDHPYLWADQSGYVLTPQVSSPGTLLRRLHALGVTDVLVNTHFFPLTPGNNASGWLYALTASQSAPLYPAAEDQNRGIVVYALPENIPLG